MPVPLDDETLNWLLSEENPPVRYLTLTRILGKSLRSHKVRDAKSKLPEYGPTKKILAQRDRFWKKGEYLYQKYRGGHWQVIFLGEFLAPRDCPGVEHGVEFILSSVKSFFGGPWYGIHCLNSNVLRALVAMGFGREPQVREGLEHVARETVDFQGVPCPIADWSIYPTCRMTLPKVLLAMTCLPEKERTRTMRRAARICVDRLLEQEVCRYVSPHAREFVNHWASLPDAPKSPSGKTEKRTAIREIKQAFVSQKGGLGELKDKPSWLRFGFPLHYNSDTLEAMVALAQAGAPKRSPRVKHALETILSRRREDGRWNMEFSLNGKMIANVERLGRPSRWITYRALYALQHFRGLELPSGGR
jgi:hypothetical protein